MQKIGQLQKYVLIKEDQKPTFFHPEGSEDQARLIKMRLLSEQALNIFVEALDADPDTGEIPDIRFLTSVPAGLEQIEFHFLGSFALIFVGGNVWLDTFDNTAFDIEMIDATSFARIHEREERDPRILEIERAARHNSMLLQQQMEADRAAFREEMARFAQEAQKNVATSSSPASSATASASAQSAAPASTGDNKSPAATSGANGGEPQGNA